MGEGQQGQESIRDHVGQVLAILEQWRFWGKIVCAHGGNPSCRWVIPIFLPSVTRNRRLFAEWGEKSRFKPKSNVESFEMSCEAPKGIESLKMKL